MSDGIIIKKWRKKPLVVEAVQFTGPASLVAMEMQWGPAFPEMLEEITSTSFLLVTSTGKLLVPLNHWVIQGIANEFIPCAPEAFAAVWEPDWEPEHPPRRVAPFEVHGHEVQEDGTILPLQEEFPL